MRRLLLLGLSCIALGLLHTTTAATSFHTYQGEDILLPSLNFEIFQAFEAPLKSTLHDDTLMMRASYTENMRSLILEESRQGFFNIRLVSAFFDESLTVEGKLAYSALELEREEHFEEDRHRFLRFRLKGTQGIFGYGAEYKYIGKHFKSPGRDKGFENPTRSESKADQAGGKVWGAWQFGVMSVRTSLWQYWNNVAADPQRPRVTTTQGEIALDIALPSWPFFSLFYQQGILASSREPKSSRVTRQQVETVGMTVYHWRSTWDVSLSSSYSVAKDQLRLGNETHLFYHEITVSYYPTSHISIAPSVSFTEERYQPSDIRYTTPGVSLSFTYSGLWRVVDVTVYGAYSLSKSTDKFMDTRSSDAIVDLTWRLGTSPLGKASVSLEVAYYRYRDILYTVNSYEELSGMLLLKISSFSL